MELSELTNKELKNILRQNNVKNYSKLNKKDLVKKVNQLIKEQNGGKREKRNNGKKKYKLKDLIGGTKQTDVPYVQFNEQRKIELEQQQQLEQQKKLELEQQQKLEQPQLKSNNSNIAKNSALNQSIANPQNSQQVVTEASAPALNQNEENRLRIQEEQRHLNLAKNRSLKNQVGIQKNNLGNNEQCKACTIL